MDTSLIQRLLDKIPQAQLKHEERTIQRKLATLPEVPVPPLIYRKTAYEEQAKDDEFSGTSMREQWAGYRDTRRSSAHKEGLKMPSPTGGLTIHDVHHSE